MVADTGPMKHRNDTHESSDVTDEAPPPIPAWHVTVFWTGYTYLVAYWGYCLATWLWP
jgi:hypothetical protein